MKKKPEPQLTPKQVAFRDITEDCRQERRRLRLSASDPMGPQNCLPYESAIREYAEVESRPDFRQFNGGYHPKKRKPGCMKPHSFRYYVYEQDGSLVKDFQNRQDALVWAGGPLKRYVVRKDLLGNYPDKKIEL